MFYLFEALGWSLVAILGNYINHLHTLAHFLTKKRKAEKKNLLMVFWAVMDYKQNNKKPQFAVSEVPMWGSEIIFPCAVRCFWWFVGQSYRKPQNFKWMLSQKHLNLIAYCHIYTRISTKRPGVLPQTSTGSVILCAFWEMTHFIALQTTTSIDAALHSQACIFFPSVISFWRWDCESACVRLSLTFTVEWLRVFSSFFFFFCLSLHLKQEAQPSNESCVWQLSLRLPGSRSFC